MLSKADAEHLTERAQSHARELARLLVQLHDGQAWKVLGYPSWTAYVTDTFDESLRTIYRYIKQGRAQEVLAGRAILSRFTGGALETLATMPPELMHTIADIAERTNAERIGEESVRAIQLAIHDTITLNAVELEDGSQVPVVDALVNGVQGKLREAVNGKREYIVANVPVWFTECKSSQINGNVFYVTFQVKKTDLHPVYGDACISIWRPLP